MSIHLPIYLYITRSYKYIEPFVYLSPHKLASPSVHMCQYSCVPVHPPVYLAKYLYMYPPIYRSECFFLSICEFPYEYLLIYLPIYLSIILFFLTVCLSFHLHVRLSNFVSTFSPNFLFFYVLVHLSFRLSICVPVSLSNHLSVNLSSHLSIILLRLLYFVSCLSCLFWDFYFILPCSSF